MKLPRPSAELPLVIPDGDGVTTVVLGPLSVVWDAERERFTCKMDDLQVEYDKQLRRVWIDGGGYDRNMFRLWGEGGPPAGKVEFFRDARDGTFSYVFGEAEMPSCCGEASAVDQGIPPEEVPEEVEEFTAEELVNQRVQEES